MSSNWTPLRLAPLPPLQNSEGGGGVEIGVRDQNSATPIRRKLWAQRWDSTLPTLSSSKWEHCRQSKKKSIFLAKLHLGHPQTLDLSSGGEWPVDILMPKIEICTIFKAPVGITLWIVCLTSGFMVTGSIPTRVQNTRPTREILDSVFLHPF